TMITADRALIIVSATLACKSVRYMVCCFKQFSIKRSGDTVVDDLVRVIEVAETMITAKIVYAVVKKILTLGLACA
ncbi:MAG: hypothetical protein ACRD5H_04585, partial [Nitrososphaerales archaeon]